jgi:hypothetical protein
VTYTLKVLEDDKLVNRYDVFIDIIANGKIIFEGSKDGLRYECNKDPSQAFCL